MDRSWVSSILLLLLILFFSNASSRGLVDEQPSNDTSNSNTTQSPPLPNVTPVGDVKSNATSSLPTTNSTSPDPKEPDSATPPPPPPPQGEKNVTVGSNTTEVISPPPANQTESQENGKLPDKVAAPPPKSPESGENKKVVETAGNPPPPAKDSEKVDDAKGSSDSAVTETCAGKSKICRTENSLVACTLSIDKDSSKWWILVQNEGEDPLIAKIVLPVNTSPYLTLTKHQSQRVNISISGDTNKIVLDAGSGECVLHMYSPQENTYSIHLPSYEKLVTPINGAYFLIVSVIIFGGAWGLCLCRKNRRAENGVPYRELEMSGEPGLESGHDVETADWDEGWDDDWDENNAVKSPGGAANSARISANGLTARGPSRDGWEDWDD